MMATSWTGHRKGTRLISPGLPGAAVLLVLVAVIAVFAVSRPAAAARRGDNWVTGWSASPQGAMPGTVAAVGFDNQTVRDIIFTSVGGDPIRLELTNAFGTAPLQVGHVTVAVAGLGAAAVPGTIHPVTFGGSASVRIPAGAQVLSDPVGMQVWPLQDLAVSVYLPGRTGAATFHSDARQVNWVSAAGDHAAEAGAGAFTTLAPSWYYLSGLSRAIVRSGRDRGRVRRLDHRRRAIDGRCQPPLAQRPGPEAGRAGGPGLSVADEGIGGNRVLTGSRCCGASAEARFARDALDQPGVRDIIVLEGINDIGFGAGPPNAGTDVSATQIIAGYEQLIAQAHARGLRIFGATLLPFQGAGYYTAAGEATREAVNTWIRTSGAFDGVIDFDAVMRDPADPLRLNPAYDSGDHLHPDDAGYQAMADAINLEMLLPRGPSAGP